MAYTYVKRNPDFVVETLTPTADAASQQFVAPMNGTYLMAVEIKSSVDDAVTFTINSGLGTELFTTTTTAATSGEIKAATDRWPVYGTPTWTLSGFSGAGTLTIVVTCVGRYR